MKYAAPAAAALVLSVFAAPVFAAGTPCDEVKAQIAAKLDAKGVVGYTLTAVPTNDVKPEDKTVGVCEAGTMGIVYVRGGAVAAPAAAPAETSPAAKMD